MMTIEVILYKTSEQEFRHWAIHFEESDKKQHTLYQITRESDCFAFDKSELKKDPSKSKTHWTAVHVTNALNDLEKAETVLEEVEIDNENPSWNCQDWVIADLESLKDDELISKYDHDKAAEELAQLCGPNDERRNKLY